MKLTFKIDEHSILPAVRLPLSDHDSRDNFLSQFRFTLFHGSKEHVSCSGCRHSVQSSSKSMDCDDVEILGSSVVGTVHRRSDRQTKRDSKLGPRGATTATLGHF